MSIHATSSAGGGAAAAATDSETPREYLLVLANTHQDFRIPELQSVALLAGFELTTTPGAVAGPALAVAAPTLEYYSPYVPLTATPRQLGALLDKSVGVHRAIEVWGTGASSLPLPPLPFS
jgi:hypothetical protein